MRNRILAALCTALVYGGPLHAQDEYDEEVEGEQEAEETGELDVAPGSGRVRTGPAQESAPGQVHTVTRGDTLWDLSQSYLGSPWYWPKVWSYNPEIANPHWIYPGNRVRFFPAGAEAPARVEVSSRPVEPDPTELGEGAPMVQATGKIGYEPTGPTRHVLEGFVTSKELEESGKIAGSFSEANMLSFPDTVYVQFKNRNDVRVGGNYLIYRTVQKVTHPKTGAAAGFLTHFAGRVRVVAINDPMVTAQITESWDEINRGDLVGPWNESLVRQAVARPNEKEIKGYVLEMMVPHVTIAGEHQVILIDQGSGAGVQAGNTFTVIRQTEGGGNFTNPAEGQDKKWPIEDIARCVVVEAKDKASVCLLVQSIREIVRGDRVITRVEGSAPTASLR
jgi:hypothetical protein